MFSSSVLGIPSRLKYEKDDLKHERKVRWGVEYEKDRCNGWIMLGICVATKQEGMKNFPS